MDQYRTSGTLDEAAVKETAKIYVPAWYRWLTRGFCVLCILLFLLYCFVGKNVIFSCLFLFFTALFASYPTLLRRKHWKLAMTRLPQQGPVQDERHPAHLRLSGGELLERGQDQGDQGPGASSLNVNYFKIWLTRRAWCAKIWNTSLKGVFHMKKITSLLLAIYISVLMAVPSMALRYTENPEVEYLQSLGIPYEAFDSLGDEKIHDLYLRAKLGSLEYLGKNTVFLNSDESDASIANL